MFIPDPAARTVRLLVKLTDSKCVLADGKPLPALKKQTSAELIIPAFAIVDEDIRESLIRERTVQLLPSGTILWSQVKNDTVAEQLAKCRVEKTIYPVEPGLFVPLELKERLDLVLRAAKQAVLKPCRCNLPALSAEAGSVNEAYTKISVAFEPSRRSHTGNVFDRVFVERKGRLVPLDNLRMAREADSQLEFPAPQ